MYYSLFLLFRFEHRWHNERFIIKQNFNTTPSDNQTLFPNTPEQDMQQNIFDKNYYRHDTINNVIVKIVQPKQAGNGMTGMYIPLLKDSSSFSIYGVNLENKESEATVRFFKTLHYNSLLKRLLYGATF